MVLQAVHQTGSALAFAAPALKADREAHGAAMAAAREEWPVAMAGGLVEAIARDFVRHVSTRAVHLWHRSAIGTPDGVMNMTWT